MYSSLVLLIFLLSPLALHDRYTNSELALSRRVWSNPRVLKLTGAESAGAIRATSSPEHILMSWQRKRSRRRTTTGVKNRRPLPTLGGQKQTERRRLRHLLPSQSMCQRAERKSHDRENTPDCNRPSRCFESTATGIQKLCLIDAQNMS